jgi:hypothetical protein
VADSQYQRLRGGAAETESDSARDVDTGAAVIQHDTKLAVELNTGIRKIVKASKNGFPFIRVDKRGNVTGTEYRRGCYCLNRGLMGELERCPEHHTIIGNHPVRTQTIIDAG